MDDLFARTRLLLGQDGLDRLAAARVAVFGIGGVGGYVVEALARSGVGALDLIDSDTVDATNLNRQIIATVDAIGRSKVEVAAERVASINPSCIVRAHQCFFLPETADQFDFAAFDYVVDAVDTVSAKIALVEAAFAAVCPLCRPWAPATNSIRRRFGWRTSTRPRSIRSPASCAANCVVEAFRR